MGLSITTLVNLNSKYQVEQSTPQVKTFMIGELLKTFNTFLWNVLTSATTGCGLTKKVASFVSDEINSKSTRTISKICRITISKPNKAKNLFSINLTDA